MKYPKSYLEEIKQRLKVSDIVGGKVKLKKRGKEFIGLSPFKNEKTPSFTVNDEKEFYHCFSSGEHGNIFDFIIKTENLGFGEAVKLLAKKAGLKEFMFSKQDIIFEDKKKKIQEIFKIYFEHCNLLLKTKYVGTHYKYLIDRGIKKETLDSFKLGYSENNLDIFNKLKVSNFTENEILDTGLFLKKPNDDKVITRFYNRIIFPIKNYYNEYIGCGGRAIDKKTFAKYINTPETAFYKKGENLYNYNISRKYFEKYDSIFLVEGYMDVINFYDKGVANVAGILGTAITIPQIKLAWKNYKNIIVCFDGDQSGYLASYRAAEKIFVNAVPGKDAFIIILKDNLDPDDFINKYKLDGLKELIRTKRKVSDFIFDYFLQEINSKDPNDLAFFEKKLMSLCDEILDKDLKKFYRSYFKNKIFNDVIRNQKNKSVSQKLINTSIKLSLPESEIRELSFLNILINYPEFSERKIEEISNIQFINDYLNEFVRDFIDLLSSNKFDSKQTFLSSLKLNNSSVIEKIVNNSTNNILTTKLNEDEFNQIFLEEINKISKLKLKLKLKTIENKLIDSMDNETLEDLRKAKKHNIS